MTCRIADLQEGDRLYSDEKEERILGIVKAEHVTMIYCASGVKLYHPQDFAPFEAYRTGRIVERGK